MFQFSTIFLHICGSFLHIFISHTTLSAQNRDGLSHAWLFEPSRVNVINVHDYNAELQQCLNVCYCFIWVERKYRICAGILIKYKVPCCEYMERAPCCLACISLHVIKTETYVSLNSFYSDFRQFSASTCLWLHTGL